MNDQKVKIHKLSNGLTLLSEVVSDVSSGAFVFLLPAGAAYDPRDRVGTATVLAEEVFRGAGALDNRGLNERLDGLGVQRHSSISSLHSCFSGSLVADNLLETLEIYSDVIREPKLSGDEFESCRELALQSLESLEDDPRQKISLLVQEHFLPYPFGRPWPGRREELQALTNEEVKVNFSEKYSPRGAILAVAGKVDFGKLKDTVEKCFGSWEGEEPKQLPEADCLSEIYQQPNEGAQVHIGLMYRSVNAVDADYYKALAAVGVLSGGMGSRLFTEVREKRGLCYAVMAQHRVIGRYGAVQCYVGSTPERAQQALDVMIEELLKLSEGITEDELERAKVGLRTSLIMQGESTTARAMACAGDYYHLGRVRSLEEIEEAIKSLRVSDISEYLKDHKPAGFAVATIGPKELEVGSQET